MMRGLTNALRLWAFVMKYRSIFSAISKSAMTPSFIGRIATILPGVRPSIFLASVAQIESAGIQHLRMRNFIPQAEAPIVSDDQEGFEPRDRGSRRPPQIGNRKQKICRCEGQVPNNGLLETGGCLRAGNDGLQTD